MDPEFPNGMCIRPVKWSKDKLRRIKKFTHDLRHGNKTVRMVKRLKNI